MPVSEWTSIDIGDVAVSGAFESLPAGQLVVSASGADVWNDSDGFRFTYHELRGDGSITARVDSIQAAHEWSKVGVMIREDTSPGARNAFVHVTESNGVLYQRRDVVDGSTADTLPDGTYLRAFDAAAPWWVRIERAGSELIGSQSRDGVNWTVLGNYSIPLPEDVLIGVAVTGRSTDASATGVFTGIELVSTDGNSDTALPPVPITGPTDGATYQRSTEDFSNPERGFHGNSSNFASVATDGFTLVRRYVRLDDYRYGALPSSFLAELEDDLASLREHGLKIVLRFSYNFGRQDDAPLSSILTHIEQLTPILQEHADVIAVMQAGFIGAWGEWHSSTNDLLDLSDRRSVTNALLDALPSSRMIQIRYPYYARDQFSAPSASSAFNGTDASRVGQVNDCFLSTSSDGGTFTSSADSTYMEAVSRYTVMGGETCAIAGLNSRNDGQNALVELERYHYDYLNHDFYEPIIDKWRDQGVFDEISRRLGYRYVLRETVSDATTRAGATFSLNVEVENEGFGKLYNPRPINLVFRPVGGGAPFTLRASDDARTVLPGPGETLEVPLTVRMPSNLPAGSYTVHLQMPDAASTLRNDPRYSVRFANQSIWNASTGENALNVTVDVD